VPPRHRQLTAHGGATRPADSSKTGGIFGFFTAKEGQTMNNPTFWIELVIVILRVFAAGMAG
jgi:hypothetical protein